MAEVVKGYSFKADRTPIDWEKVLDGQTWFLEFGVDLDWETPAESFRARAYKEAKSRHMRLSINKSKRSEEKQGFYIRGTKIEGTPASR